MCFELFTLRNVGRLIAAAIFFQYAGAVFHQAEATLTAGQSMIVHLSGNDAQPFHPTGFPGY